MSHEFAHPGSRVAKTRPTTSPDCYQDQRLDRALRSLPTACFLHLWPRTPRDVPAGAPALDPPGVWEHPTWLSLGLSFSRPHSYSFEFESDKRGRRSRYVASAQGDLDGDGQLSSFSVRGEVAEGQAPVTLPLEVRREVE